MDATPDQLAGARAYDDVFVPALTGVWAPVVAQAAGVGPGDRVLDVACGTGVVAREAARRVGPGGSVTGVDPNAGMLAVARDHGASIAYHQGRAEDLPFADASFDVAVSQFGMMFFEDPAAAIAEMRRVVRPGGRLAVAVWATIDAIPAYAAELALFERVAGPPAAGALRAPFALGDPLALGALFEAPGVPPPQVSTHVGAARFPSIGTLVAADLRGWLPIMGVHLPEDVITRTLAEADAAIGPHVTREQDGSVTFATSVLVVRQGVAG